MKEKIECVLFDLDGTLVDSFPSIIIAFKEAFKILSNSKEWSDDEIRKLIGIPHQETFRKICNDYKKIEEATNVFRETRKKFKVNAIDGSIDILKFLKDKNFKIGVVTTTGRDLTEKILNDLNIINLFDVIVTGNDVQNFKPHPEPILKAIKALNINKNRCVMVGDHPNDIIAAKSANVKSIAILYAHTQTEFLNYHPDYIVNSIKEIKKILEE